MRRFIRVQLRVGIAWIHRRAERSLSSTGELNGPLGSERLSDPLYAATMYDPHMRCEPEDLQVDDRVHRVADAERALRREAASYVPADVEAASLLSQYQRVSPGPFLVGILSAESKPYRAEVSAKVLGRGRL